MKNRLTNSTVGAIESRHTINTIFESTLHHNRHLSSLAKRVDMIWSAISWQPSFQTPGQHELNI